MSQLNSTQLIDAAAAAEHFDILQWEGNGSTSQKGFLPKNPEIWRLCQQLTWQSGAYCVNIKMVV